MSTSPRVSVIIATYNRSAVLRHAIVSVLAQTFSDFELLVVGDGCTDDSATVVASFGDARIGWTNLPANSGHQSTPNNEGLCQARGELIAYLGHDDLWLPHHLACMVEAFDRGADVVCGITAIVGPEGRYRDIFPQRPVYSPGMSMSPSGLMHRLAVTQRTGGWRLHREAREDPETALLRAAAAVGFRIEIVPRLVTIKFPAAMRPGVYRSAGSGEQTAWWARICDEPAFEQEELGHLLYAAKHGEFPTSKPFAGQLRDFLRETRRRVRQRWRSYHFLLAGRGSRIDASRRRKGLGPGG